MYYLADLFTLTEVILSVVLFVMAVVGAPVEQALWVFVAGELCDAVDGPCARRWHYPNDGKSRWWRTYNSEIDQISDILLAIACGVYLIWRVSWIGGSLLLFGIGAICLAIQGHLYHYDRNCHIFRRRNYIYAENLILFRRRLYVVGGIGGALALYVWHTEWPLIIKAALTIIGILCGIALRCWKHDRWTEDKTPL